VFTFTVYADYYQFYLGDSTFAADSRCARLLEPGSFGARARRGAARAYRRGDGVDDYVQVTVELASVSPDDSGAQWDRVVEASLEVPSGPLAIDGCTNYRPESSPHIEVAPGTYRVRVLYAAQDSLEHDWYRFVLWPRAPYAAPSVIQM
jgi:hypothetical protein